MGPEMNFGSFDERSAMAARGSPQLASGLSSGQGEGVSERTDPEATRWTDPQKCVDMK